MFFFLPFLFTSFGKIGEEKSVCSDERVNFSAHFAVGRIIKTLGSGTHSEMSTVGWEGRVEEGKYFSTRWDVVRNQTPNALCVISADMQFCCQIN